MALTIRCTLGVQITGGSKPKETTHALIAERYILMVDGASPSKSKYPMYLRSTGSWIGRGEMECAAANLRKRLIAVPYPVLLLGAHPAAMREETWESRPAREIISPN